MQCEVCGGGASVMKRCVQCKSVIYCSKSCQIKDWPHHKLKCMSPSHQQTSANQKLFKNQEHGHMKLIINHNHKKHSVVLPKRILHASNILAVISEQLRIPANKLNLIAKGKVVTEENVIDIVFDKKIKHFMAVGEARENEDGMHKGDIETIVQQLNVDRNKAVRALKHCNGNLIDAMIYLGDLL